MEADFKGYVTKTGLKCSDGRTIMPDAFKHQDKAQVPLVWQHGHNDPENVLGHVILENRPDGVYGYGFFNETKKAIHTQTALEHKDFNSLSIWANQLLERGKMVMHGLIREVSLVLSGANPGALIEHVNIRHSDGDVETLDDEVIIFTGLELEHSDLNNEKPEEKPEEKSEDEEKEVVEHADKKDDEETVQDVYDSMNEKQKDVLHYMVGQALEANSAEHSNVDDNNDDKNNDSNNDDTKGSTMKHNVFEDGNKDEDKTVLSHSDMLGILEDARRGGSLKDAVESYALAHNITDIETLFPDAVSLDQTPQFLQRRVEWVSKFIGGVRKSPFSRIKTVSADITMEEARAKGYVKGTLKREEFFGVTKRQTTPTTVYKKQSLDRDDVVDITDFDVVVWLKAEMRVMLDEEIARAALVGDGRDPSHEDKISETNIRPIVSDHELFVTTINVNIDDASSSVQEVIDAIVRNRSSYKGTGQPNLYCAETLISMFMLLKDGMNRRMYRNLDEVASELRVNEIVPVEILEEYPNILGVIVNPIDYVFGSTAGGQVTMFDDFDIDYNKQKYLIETRLSGALTKLKSALVIRKVAGTAVLVAPAAPTFDSETGALTIVNTTGVVYKNSADAVVNAAGSPYTVDPGESETITATPATGYYFATSDDDTWTFTADA